MGFVVKKYKLFVFLLEGVDASLVREFSSLIFRQFRELPTRCAQGHIRRERAEMAKNQPKNHVRNLRRHPLAPILVISAAIFVIVSINGTENLEFKEVSTLQIPDGVRIVGFGEATHGSHEFKQLASDTFKMLVQQHGFRVFAAEASFSSSLAANNYIIYGIGSASEVAANLGAWFHNFQETVDLVGWMRHFNMTAEAGDEIRFFGFDIYEVANSRQNWLNFVGADDGSLDFANTLSSNLPFTSYEELSENIMTLERIIDEAQGDGVEFEFAFQSLVNLKFATQMAIIAGEGGPTAATLAHRGQKMFENLLWIAEQEEKAGRGGVFVFAHNGHIMRTSFQDVQSLGGHLSARFDDEYLAIGTSFHRGNTIVWNPSQMSFTEFSMNMSTNRLFGSTRLTRAFVDADMDVALLDINNQKTNQTLNSRQRVGAVGTNALRPAHRNTLSLVPDESFDKMIFVRTASPANN